MMILVLAANIGWMKTGYSIVILLCAKRLAELHDFKALPSLGTPGNSSRLLRQR